MSYVEDLEMVRGDTTTWNFAVTQDGDPYNIGGASFWFTGKRTMDATTDDSVKVFQRTLGDGITITDALNGLGSIQMAASDTYNLETYKVDLYYDFQIKIGSEIFTLTRGKMVIWPDVTRRTT